MLVLVTGGTEAGLGDPIRSLSRSALEGTPDASLLASLAAARKSRSSRRWASNSCISCMGHPLRLDVVHAMPQAWGHGSDEHPSGASAQGADR